MPGLRSKVMPEAVQFLVARVQEQRDRTMERLREDPSIRVGVTTMGYFDWLWGCA